MLNQLIGNLLQGKKPSWPIDGSISEQKFIIHAQNEGILPLLNIRKEYLKSDWPLDILKAILVSKAVSEEIERIRCSVISQVIDQLNEIDINVLLFKGASNAYIIYDFPYLRQHADIDVFIKADDYLTIKSALESQGFKFEQIQPTKYGPFQVTTTLTRKGSPDVVIDLHWKINNRLLLADVLSFDELMQDSINIKEYGSHACGAGLIDALLIACIHDAGSLSHEKGRLIGLYDVYLLLRNMNHETLQSAAKKAKDKGVYGLFISYLLQSVKLFGDENQKIMLKELDDNVNLNEYELSSNLLKTNRTWLDDHLLDWQAVQGISNKLGYLTGKLFSKITR